jgi:hypothetical protein
VRLHGGDKVLVIRQGELVVRVGDLEAIDERV